LDDGSYTCERGHKVIIESGVLEPQEVKLSPREAQLLEKGLEDVKAGRTQSLEEVRAGLAPAQDTAVAVAEEPQAYQAQIVPGSSRMRQGGALELTLLVPEQYVGPLRSYCQGIGKTVEEFVNEVVANGFENGWFV
jgi:hypothetical protein